MTLGKSLRLSACNWKVLLKSVFCQAVIFAVVVALAATMFGGVVGQVADAFAKSGIVDFVKDTVSSIASGTFNPSEFADGVQGIVVAFQDALREVQSDWGHIEWTYLLFLVVIFAYRMLISVTDVAVDCQLEEFMTSNATRPFSWFFFKKQGETWAFTALQTVFVMPLDMAIFFGCLGFYLVFLITFRWWTIIPIAIIGLLMYAARMTLFAFCLPAVVTEKDMSVGEAFRYGLSTVFRRFGQVYWKNLVVVTLVAAIFLPAVLFIKDPYLMAVVGVLPNFILYFIQKNINMCEYFEATERPYFSKVVEVEGTERYNKKHKAVVATEEQ